VLKLNHIPSRRDHLAITPIEKFKGTKSNYEIDHQFSFLEFCHTEEGGTNNMDKRTQACLALYPAGTRDGCTYFYNLATGKVIKRNKMKKMTSTNKKNNKEISVTINGKVVLEPVQDNLGPREKTIDDLAYKEQIEIYKIKEVKMKKMMIIVILILKKSLILKQLLIIIQLLLIQIAK
jgi:hypothetical protein